MKYMIEKKVDTGWLYVTQVISTVEAAQVMGKSPAKVKYALDDRPSGWIRFGDYRVGTITK